MQFKDFVNRINVYHGSKTPIESWDSTKHLSGYYPGFYAWTDRNKARNHGEHVYQLAIDTKRFYLMKSGDELKKLAIDAGFPTTMGSGFQDVKYLKSQGYKGIIRGEEHIVFNPEEWEPYPKKG